MITLSLLCGWAALIAQVSASGHREAPFVGAMKKMDSTDFYLFKSYEPGRENHVTFISNFITLDKDLRYEINVDNNGDAQPDLTFAFRFNPPRRDNNTLNVLETYTVDLYRRINPTDSELRLEHVQHAHNHAHNKETTFIKPIDNDSNKSIPDYASYASRHIYKVSIPHCGLGRLFVGQRKAGFSVNLGEVFNLVNTDPASPHDSKPNNLENKKIMSLAMEVPASCLTQGRDPVVGAWTTVSKPLNGRLRDRSGGRAEHSDWAQTSRLGNPLVNEWMIGLNDKDSFNASKPYLDAHYASYMTNPTLPVIIESLFGARAPTANPRSDLARVFLTGVDGLNKPKAVRAAEMLRLNTSTPALSASQQNSLGVLSGDMAGFPNGRRPGDDVVDIVLRIAMGALLDASVAPDGQLPYNDGITIDANMFGTTFPYVLTP